MRRAIQGAVSAFALAAAMFSGTVMAAAAPAGAAVSMTVPDTTIGQHILDKAETRRGYWYVYGDAGPRYFDCSGLVSWAAGQLGHYIPHSTYTMLGNPGAYGLVRVTTPQRGDLAFYGSGHVEFVTSYYHTTFGALKSGTRIGWHPWSPYWHPTVYYRIK